MATRKAAPCGTYGGYQRHAKRGEEPCQPCKDANARYHREYRRNNPDSYTREIAMSAARGRALERLAREYPKRFLAILYEEQAPFYEPAEVSR